MVKIIIPGKPHLTYQGGTLGKIKQKKYTNKYRIHVRSFISAKRAGTDPLAIDFRGDGRKASLKDSGINLTGATSRAKIILGWDSPDKKAELINIDSDLTVRFESSPLGYAEKKPQVDASALETVNTANPNHVPGCFGVKYKARDPLTPKMGTPFLDVKVSGIITEGDGFIKIKGTAFGDGFPSTEAFIEDRKGIRVFLGTHKEEGNVVDLYGGTEVNIFNFDLKLKVNDEGLFESIYNGNSLIAIDVYNKQVQEKFDN